MPGQPAAHPPFVRPLPAKVIAALQTQAKAKAAQLGGKPILVINEAKLLAGGPLFTCAPPTPELVEETGLEDMDLEQAERTLLEHFKHQPSIIGRFPGPYTKV